MPPDITVEVAFDNTQYVRRSLLEVTETIFIAFVLVVLVVFAFLREWRTTLIPVLAIPVSIIGTFAIMTPAGFSINTLTLLGIVLAIGLVVDDAIVVLENIYAKIESGHARRSQAGIDGTQEIFFAVVSTTLTLAVVFLPLLFMGGLSGRLFREFGVTIAGAVLISALVALTLTPMLSARLLRRTRSAAAGLFRKTEPFFTGAGARLRARRSARFLRRPLAALAMLVGAAALIFVLLARAAARARAAWRIAAASGCARTGAGGRRLRVHAELHGRARARDGASCVPEAQHHDDAGARPGGAAGRAGRREHRLRARVPQGHERARALAAADRG